MTPKEKAKELFDKMSKQTYSFQEYAGAYYSIEEIGWEAGKKCSLILVDEIINVVKRYETKKGKLLIDNINLLYWQEVKQEIEKR